MTLLVFYRINNQIGNGSECFSPEGLRRRRRLDQIEGGAVKSEALSKGASKSNVKTFYDVAYEPRLPVRSYVRIYGEATRHKEREGVGPDLKFDLRHRL